MPFYKIGVKETREKIEEFFVEADTPETARKTAIKQMMYSDSGIQVEFPKYSLDYIEEIEDEN